MFSVFDRETLATASHVVSYDDVNSAWSMGLPLDLPTLTSKDAQRYALKLITSFGSRKMAKGHTKKLSRSWASTKNTRNEAHAGWRRMVHDTSHYVHARLHRYKFKGHSHVHAKLELAMIRHVLACGWTSPSWAVKAKPTTNDKRAAELKRVDNSLRNWTRKHKLATTKLRKLTARRKRLTKLLASA